MSSSPSFSVEGGCSCGEVRYRLTDRPIFVHGCHCTWCQRQSGSAFAINAMIETDRVEILAGKPEPTPTPSPSGKGQTILRCPTCRIAVWSHYAGAGDKLAFVRAGSLDDTTRIEPDIHIYTSTKQPWVTLPQDKHAVPEYYNAKEMMPPESLARMAALRG
jgi:hypothetical protein